MGTLFSPRSFLLAAGASSQNLLPTIVLWEYTRVSRTHMGSLIPTDRRHIWCRGGRMHCAAAQHLRHLLRFFGHEWIVALKGRRCRRLFRPAMCQHDERTFSDASLSRVCSSGGGAAQFILQYYKRSTKFPRETSNRVFLDGN